MMMPGKMVMVGMMLAVVAIMVFTVILAMVAFVMLAVMSFMVSFVALMRPAVLRRAIPLVADLQQRRSSALPSNDFNSTIILKGALVKGDIFFHATVWMGCGPRPYCMRELPGVVRLPVHDDPARIGGPMGKPNACDLDGNSRNSKHRDGSGKQKSRNHQSYFSCG
jgi:hypothetical protein